jgi:hypothetical protein
VRLPFMPYLHALLQSSGVIDRRLVSSRWWLSLPVRAVAPRGTGMLKVAKWGIGIGILIGFLGLVFIAAGFPSRQTDPGPIVAGLTVFAMGLLTVSASFYVQARAIRAQFPRESNGSGLDKRKNLCDLCRKAPAVILCTMHKTTLCPSCLAAHYDSRGCVYVPASRRTSSRTVRSAAASRG